MTVFELNSNDLNRVFVKATIYGLMNDKEIQIGFVHIGPRKSLLNNLSLSHWQQMIRKLRRQVNISF